MRSHLSQQEKNSRITLRCFCALLFNVYVFVLIKMVQFEARDVQIESSTIKHLLNFPLLQLIKSKLIYAAHQTPQYVQSRSNEYQ